MCIQIPLQMFELILVRANLKSRPYYSRYFLCTLGMFFNASASITFQEKLLAELKKSKVADNYDFGLLLLDTGMRYMEAASLPWTAIDMDKRSISVYRSKVNNQNILRMTERVYAMMVRRFAEKSVDRYVFMNKDGSAHRQYNRNGIDNAFDRAGLNDLQIVKEKGSKATAHTLRHTFASKLAQKGMSLYEIGKLLGHNSSATTEIYAHLCPNAASIKAVQLLEN